jgi:catechol-2,3-dioxygenase
MAAGRWSGRLRTMQNEAIHPAVRVGHVHLHVADLDRAIAFYATRWASA